MLLQISAIIVVCSLFVFIFPLPFFGKKCAYCGKLRPALFWLFSLDKHYCDDCLDKFNADIRNKKNM